MTICVLSLWGLLTANGGGGLDKTGTTPLAEKYSSSQQLIRQQSAEVISFTAERKGFEPLVQFYPHAALAKRCFRPLSHLSDLDES